MSASVEPGSARELAEFARLQQRLPDLIQRVFEDRLAPRTVVVVPSLSLDEDSLGRIPGVLHYEERQLSMLLLLRMPNTRLVYVTSQPLHPLVVDYYLNMMQGVPSAHARRRLTLLSAYDGSLGPLSRKLLERPRLLSRLAAAIGDPDLAHLSVFSSSPLERTLAVRLGIPLYACDPALMPLGGKSGSRALFAAAGVACPAGAANLRDRADVVEAWLDGADKRSPSAQFRIVPRGAIESVSTHDQVLGGPQGQLFEGSLFPASAGYRPAIHAAGLAVAERLRDRGVIGRVGVDFVVTREDGRRRAWAIEINLRKGGTTHPFQMLQYLSDGHYDADDGEFRTRSGEPRCYYATDNLSRACYRSLTPDDVIEVAVQEGLHFDPATQCGVAFGLLGCVSEHGKLGLTAIGGAPRSAQALYAQAVAALDRAAGCAAEPPPQR